MNRLSRLCISFVFGSLACVALSFPADAATTAGRVVFALGSPKATDTAGAERVLARGDEVFSGDSLATAARERLQVSMVDGAYISVQPGSTYVIENYVYNGKPDGTEDATYHLVKGGVRALTGLIGKSKPDAYKVKTAVATIGIRGTGHNTRICQGDCGTLPDGLYHSTWEGITYVENNVDSKDVVAGRAVYVRDINTMIQFLEQTPGVVAAIVAAVTEEAATEEEETEPVFQQGEAQQVTSTVSMLPDFLMTDVVNFESVFVAGDYGFFDVYGFFNGGGQLIGALLTEPVSSSSSSSSIFAEIRTIDLAAMQSGSDPVAAQIVSEILTHAASDSTATSDITHLQENPASVAEFFSDSTLGVGWGRWSNGHVLTLDDEDGSVSSYLSDLVNNQSVHFIFGPEPPATLPASGMATYNFLGGTQSTSLNGSTIGEGATGGTITLDFAAAFGTIDMDVSHNSNTYAMTGDLFASDINFVTGDGDATTSASGSACQSSCGFFLIGSFAGTTSDNNPQFINFQYQVDETDPFIGVASFKFESISVPTSTIVDAGNIFTGVGPSFSITGAADFYLADTATGFLDASNDFIGLLATKFNSSVSRREIITINLDDMLGVNDASVLSEVQSLVNLADSNLINTFKTNPASIAELSFDPTTGIGWGRWSNGLGLSIQEDGTTETANLTGNQSFHFIFGVTPPFLPTTGIATYDFMGGTQSTSVSGATIGLGVTNGSISVDFASTTASLSMDVNHNAIDYAVSGPLGFISSGDENELYDTGSVIATSSSSTCSSCSVTINGGFTGPTAMGTYPRYSVLGYAIQETDAITGVAAFDLASLVLPSSTVIPIDRFVAVESDLGLVDTTNGLSGSGFLDSSNQLIGVLFTDADTLDRDFGTIDLDAVLGGDDPAAVAEVQSLYDAAPNSSTAAATVAANPASVAESFYDATNGIGWGRWTNGSYLTFDDTGSPAEAITLTGNQSVHFIFGSAPPDISGLTSTATYNFIGGTQSTTVSGSGIVGNGVTSGDIVVDFSLSEASLSMVVDHGTTYNVSGFLFADPTDGGLYTDSSFTVSATSSSPGCSSCSVDIDGGFAGPAAAGGVPQFAGIEYGIQDSTDPIMGVAGFEVGP